MVNSRIARLVFGTREPRFGAVESKFKLLTGNGLNHRVEIESGVLAEECAAVLKAFFKEKRVSKKAVDQKTVAAAFRLRHHAG